MIRLADLIRTPLFQNAKVLAGQAGVERNVTSVNMMDAPDIVDFLKRDELLLTTAYALKDNVSGLERLVAGMAKQGCAGLGIKTKRFFSDIPVSVLRIADEFQFPIIELPLEHALGDLLTQSLSFILEKHTTELRHSIQAHQEFTTLLMNGGGLVDILGQLERMLELPLAVFDHNAELVGASPSMTPIQIGRITAVVEQVSYAQSHHTGTVHVCLVTTLGEEEGPELRLAPVRADQKHGYLATLGSGPAAVSPLAQLTIEQATNVIAFESMKRRAVRERSRRYKNEFFSDFLENKVSSEQEVINRGKPFRLKQHTAYQCIVGKMDPTPQRSSANKPVTDATGPFERDHMYELMKSELRRQGIDFVMCTKNDQAVAVVYLDADFPNTPDMSNCIKDLQIRMMKRAAIAPSFGLGERVSRLMDIPRSYSKAIRALDAGFRANKRQFIQDYQTMDMQDLLSIIPQKDLHDYYDSTLGALLDADAQERANLTMTVLAYLDHQQNVAETAKALYVHRNTVLYRLQKFEALTGRNVREAGEALRVHLALAVAPLLGHS